MSSLRSYPKIYALGHKAIRSIFEGPVVVQEKVDGSQFSFGVIEGKLVLRSRGQEIQQPCSNALFAGAAATATRLFEDGKLVEGWIYRGEVISKPKHNTLEYARVPVGNVILFDIDTGLEERMQPRELLINGLALGLEVVPTFTQSIVDSPEDVKAWLGRESVLGGCNIEGVVVKNYSAFNSHDGNMMMGKYVCDSFKEKHVKSWKVANPTKKDAILSIIDALSTDARFEKGVQRRRDAGLLADAPEDIGPIMSDIMRDTVEEEEGWIKHQLYARFEKEILRGTVKRFPFWYKERLLAQQFETEVAVGEETPADGPFGIPCS